MTFRRKAFGMWLLVTGMALSCRWWSGEYVVAEAVAHAQVAGALSAAPADEGDSAHGGVGAGGVGCIRGVEQVGADQLGGGLFFGAGRAGPTLWYRQPADFGGRGQAGRGQAGRVKTPPTGTQRGKLRRRKERTLRAGRRSHRSVEQLLTKL